ncbi:hypothetical protein BDV39DRAFT_90969 [Aspergillus sergii]|uniref:Uncharacterized protein n=1 Tax=Aspergillus sergii TaxID=1034303 RepID=A0A5N6X4Q8_9EURO|nr:hypothetical protein BDV39DRAFT_90969 [Aspergillus sergii]
MIAHSYVSNPKKLVIFRNVIPLLGFPTPKLYDIPVQDRTLCWNLNHKTHVIFDHGLTAEGWALLLIHYAGHGMEKDGTLFLHWGWQRNFCASYRPKEDGD